MFSTAATVRADLHVLEPVADVGTVYTGAALVHEFAFVNEGPETVTLLEARAGCGCLRPRFVQSTYRPGEKGGVVVEINTLTQATGPHTWTVTLKYQTGTTARELPLRLKGQLVSEVAVQPAALIVFADKIAQHELVLTDSRAKPLAVTAVCAGSTQLSARIGEALRNARGQTVRTIHLAVADDYPDGRHEEILTIYTDDLRYRELRVPVTILKRARQRLAAAPSQVELVAPAGQALPSRMVLLRDEQGQPVHVERIWCEDPTVSCHWAPGPGALATLRVQAEQKLGAGESFQTAVHVRVDQPVAETLSIPVICKTR